MQQKLSRILGGKWFTLRLRFRMVCEVGKNLGGAAVRTHRAADNNKKGSVFRARG